MNIKKDIEKFSLAEDKPVLFWLFKNYHWQSQWNFVAKCKHEPYQKDVRFSPIKLIWYPTEEGKILYNHYMQNKENNHD